MLMRLRDKIMKRSEEKEAPESEDSPASDKAAPKPQDDRRKKIVRAVIIVALVALIAQEFIPSDEDPNAPVEMSAEEKKMADAIAERKKAREAAKKKIADEKAAAAAAATPTETPTPTTPAEPTEPVLPTTPTDVSSLPTETPVDPGVPTAPAEPETSITPETSPVTVNETPTETPTEPVLPTEEPPAVTEPTPSTTDGEATEEPAVTTSPDQVDGGVVSGGDTDMTEQMLKELEKQANVPKVKAPVTEYAGPPDYEFKGRGLVYNCAGKHWACVDGPSYRRCEDNSASVKFLKKKSECYPFNVYETLQGCETVQNRMVSSSAKTDFCNEL